MTNITATREFIDARRHVDVIATAAQLHRIDMPADYRVSTAVAAAAKAIAAEPEPYAAIPTATKAVRKFCDDMAAARAAWRGRVDVANATAEASDIRAVRVALDAGPMVAAAVTDHANGLLPNLDHLLNAAPRALTGHETPDQLAAHAELLRTVQALTVAARMRVELAAAIGESNDLGRDGLAWLFLDPRPATLTSTVQTLLSAPLPSTVDGWAMVHAVGLRFAVPGEAAGRYDRWRRLQAAQVGTDDGGMRDRTVGELQALAAA